MPRYTAIPKKKRKRRRRIRKDKFTVGQVKDALEKSAGIYTQAAAILAQSTGGTCTRQTVSKMVSKYPTLQAAMDEIDERVLDLAEAQSLKLLKEGDGAHLRWFLGKKGARRGYGDKLTVEGEVARRATLDVNVSLQGRAKELGDKFSDETLLLLANELGGAPASGALPSPPPPPNEAGGSGPVIEGEVEGAD